MLLYLIIIQNRFFPGVDTLINRFENDLERFSRQNRIFPLDHEETVQCYFDNTAKQMVSSVTRFLYFVKR